MLLLLITLGRGLLWDDCLALRTDQYPKDSSRERQRPYDWQSIPIAYFPANIVIPCLRPLKASSLTVVDPAESDTDRPSPKRNDGQRGARHREVSRNSFHFSCEGSKENRRRLGSYARRKTLPHGVAKPISVPIRLSKGAGELRAERGSLIAPHRLWHNTD